jgi:hypothetical protein
MSYVVTAPLVIATAVNGSQHHLYQGSPIPDYIGKDEIKRLADDGHIAQTEDAPADEAPVFERPAGNASLEAWTAYVLESDQASEDEIKGMSRDELREKYGN